jgi:O-antigen ligase
MCVVLLVLVFAPEKYGDRLSSITNEKTVEEGTAGERMFTWGIGWEMFLSNPIFGVGQGNFPWTVGDYLGGRTWQTRSLAGRAAHSLYFTLLPELGLVGVILFGGMIYFSYRDVKLCKSLVARRRVTNAQNLGQENEAIERVLWFGNAMVGALIAYLITSAFISTLYYPTFWILVGLIVALRSTALGQFTVKDENALVEPRGRNIALPRVTLKIKKSIGSSGINAP